jgi:hypothetical protein
MVAVSSYETFCEVEVTWSMRNLGQMCVWGGGDVASNGIFGYI